MLLPLPILLPLQPPLYQRQTPPVPKLPPLMLSVVLLPEQIVLLLAVMLLAAVEFDLTVTVTCRQPVVLQVPSART